MFYKRIILHTLLLELYPTTLYPGILYCYGTSYDSITLINTDVVLIPEAQLDELYLVKLLSYNLNIFRKERNLRLAACDFYMLPDYPQTTDEFKQRLIVYRKSLRDITQLYPEPETDENDNLINIIWPVL